MKKCENCGYICNPERSRCPECQAPFFEGADNVTLEIDASDESSSRSTTSEFGTEESSLPVPKLLIAFGFSLVAVSFFLKVEFGDSGIVNYQLLQRQMMLLIAGLGTSIVGSILMNRK